MTSPEIVHLSDRQDLIPSVAALMIENWPEWYGRFGPGDALADLERRSQVSGLPWGGIAILDNLVVGTVALASESHGAEPGEDTWLVGLVVRDVMRKRGIGSQLVEVVEHRARTEGFVQVYATTQSASGLLVRRGWQSVRDLVDGYCVFRFSTT